MQSFVSQLRSHLDAFLPRHHQSAIALLSVLLLFLMLARAQEWQARDELVHDDSLLPPPASTRLVELTVPLPEPRAEGPPDELGPPAPDDRLYLTVQPGDNLSLLFKRAGLGPAEVQMLTRSGSDGEILASLHPGQQLAFDLASGEEGTVLHSLELIRSPLESYVFYRNAPARFSATHILRQPHIEVVHRAAVIEDSLFLAAQATGIKDGMTLELASIFGGVVDFMLETRAGDSFSLLFEEEYLDGELIGTGRILAASFTNQGTRHVAVRYTGADGDSDFYNPQGESMRKAFLQNPVDFTRISSNFSLARRHPILNTIRAHRGTDYAAPRGTPVVATSDGRVTFAGRNGSFGNLVVLQHGTRFETKYAHLNEFARGIKSGARVSQGQIIGYVGATGSATGPHLHYEFLMDGVHRNWRTVQDELPKAESIDPAGMDDFRSQTQVLLSLLDSRGASLEAGTAVARP